MADRNEEIPDSNLGALVGFITSSHADSDASATRLTGHGERSEPPRSKWDANLRVPIESLEKLERLLTMGPINLNTVSEEIRAHPDLEAMIVRLGGSLALAEDYSNPTVEKAAVALGTERLLILVYAWSLLRQNGSPLALAAHDTSLVSTEASCQALAERSDWPAPQFAEAGNFETVYLASFLHWLGLDCRRRPDSAQASSFGDSIVQTEHFANMTEVFMRDFIALIPFLDRTVLAPVAGRGRRISEQSRRAEESEPSV